MTGIADVEGADPWLDSSAAAVTLSSDSAKLTLNGRGFETDIDKIQLSFFTGGESPSPVDSVVSAATRTQLVASFTHLAPTDAGSLKAECVVSVVFVQGIPVTEFRSPRLEVAGVNAARPTVLESAGVLSSDASMLTIRGKVSRRAENWLLLVHARPHAPMNKTSRAHMPKHMAAPASFPSLTISATFPFAGI